MWDLGVRGIEQSPTFDDSEIRVRQQREINPLFRRILREFFCRIRTDRPDLRIDFCKRRQVFLQLTELATTKWSPETPIEDQYPGTIDGRQ